MIAIRLTARTSDATRPPWASAGNYWLDAFKESGLKNADVMKKASALADEVKSQKVLKEAQQSLRQQSEELEPFEKALHLLRSGRYKCSKMHKAAVDSGSDLDSTKNKNDSACSSSSSMVTISTWELPACKDRAEKTDIRNIIRNARGTSRLVMSASTDYGLPTTSKMAYITIDFSNFIHFKEHLSATVSTSGLLVRTDLKVNRAQVYARRTSTRPTTEDISAWVPYGDDLCDLPLSAYYELDGDYVEYYLGEPERQFFLTEPLKR
ncbi:hypothetical protein BGZ68_005985 [Mortierella alpina]|nr:hypothetical protein BGZ68_005985 [Mortierella alpina]